MQIEGIEPQIILIIFDCGRNAIKATKSIIFTSIRTNTYIQPQQIQTFSEYKLFITNDAAKNIHNDSENTEMHWSTMIHSMEIVLSCVCDRNIFNPNNILENFHLPLS